VGAVQTTQQRAVASAQLDAARAQRTLASVTLREHTLVAPFDGTVVHAPDGVGAVVGPAQTLFQLANLKTLKLIASVSESDANLLRVGAKVVLDTEQGRVEGRISSLLEALEERTRRVPVQSEFDNPGSLRAGSFVRARVDAGDAVDVLRLPHDVLRPGSQNEVLVVVAGPTATLAVRKIVHALDTAGNLLVRAGLAAEDSVVLNPKPEAKALDQVVVVAPRTRAEQQ
jgi:RND family efflux transporter MFP subunit